MSENWLQSYLVESVQKDLCTRIYCTTCGAMEFRRGVINALASSKGIPPPEGMYPWDALAIARALSEVNPADRADTKLISAVRCLLFDLCGTFIGEGDITQVLGDSWGGNVLRGMQEHHRARQAARAASEEEQKNGQERRKEKMRLVRERHEQRLALKKERDRAWRETHGRVD